MKYIVFDKKGKKHLEVSGNHHAHNEAYNTAISLAKEWEGHVENERGVKIFIYRKNPLSLEEVKS